MTLPTWALTTVAAARIECHVTATDHDEKLEQLVRAASARINGFCGYRLKSMVYSDALDTRMALDGNDTPRLRLSAFPVTALASCVYLNESDVEFPINITGARVDRDSGLVTLMQDYFPAGTMNILVSCTAGLTDDDPGLSVVEQAALRLVAAWYDRWRNALGITTTATEGGVKTEFAQDEMPQEVCEMLRPFVWLGWT